MKKKLFLLLVVSTLSYMLVGCGNQQETNSLTSEQPTTTAEQTAETTAAQTAEQTTEATAEETHSHTYTESITTNATCTENGEKTLTCACGDTYTEEMQSTGHQYGNYVSKQDGTETAICNICRETDTRTAEDSKLTYTFTDLSGTKYTKSTVNVRALPNTDGEKIGELTPGQEVEITGQCNETKWYRLKYNDTAAYVSDSYLTDEKPAQEIQITTQQAQKPTQQTDTAACPYALYTIYYDNQGYPYFYGKYGGSANMDAENYSKTTECEEQISNYMHANYTIPTENGSTSSFGSSWRSIGTYSGMRIVVRYIYEVNYTALSTPEERGIPTAGNGI